MFLKKTYLITAEFNKYGKGYNKFKCFTRTGVKINNQWMQLTIKTKYPEKLLDIVYDKVLKDFPNAFNIKIINVIKL